MEKIITFCHSMINQFKRIHRTLGFSFCLCFVFLFKGNITIDHIWRYSQNVNNINFTVLINKKVTLISGIKYFFYNSSLLYIAIHSVLFTTL